MPSNGVIAPKIRQQNLFRLMSYDSKVFGLIVNYMICIVNMNPHTPLDLNFRKAMDAILLFQWHVQIYEFRNEIFVCFKQNLQYKDSLTQQTLVVRMQLSHIQSVFHI